MGKMLRIEISRAFKNKIFLGVLLFCCVLIVWQLITYVFPSLPFLYERRGELEQKGVMLPSLFQNGAFLGFGMGLSFTIFHWTLPILIVLPFASSFFAEQKSGYIKNLFLRTEKRNYFVAKYIAVFLNAGTVAVLPVLISLWASALFLPALMPQTSGGSPLGAHHLWGELFYQNPLAYIFYYCIIQFIFYGLMATIALAVSFLTDTRFVVLLTPFLLNLMISFLCAWTQNYRFAPVDFLNMQQMIPSIELWIIVVEAIVLFLLTSVGFIVVGCRKEVY